MLTNEEHQAMIMFDRLLMAAKDNETVADLLDQTLNVARMIDPRPDDKVVYGPLQRMHFEWQAMQHRMNELGKKIDQYIANQNRYGGTYTATTGMSGMAGMATGSMWPSNPGFETGYNYKSEVDWNIPIGSNSITAEHIKKIQADLMTMSENLPDVSMTVEKTNK